MFSAAPWTAVLALVVIEVVIVLAVRLGLAARHLFAARHQRPRHQRPGRRIGLSVPPGANA
jgi:hypothetical protein